MPASMFHSWLTRWINITMTQPTLVISTQTSKVSWLEMVALTGTMIPLPLIWKWVTGTDFTMMRPINQWKITTVWLNSQLQTPQVFLLSASKTTWDSTHWPPTSTSMMSMVFATNQEPLQISSNFMNQARWDKRDLVTNQPNWRRVDSHLKNTLPGCSDTSLRTTRDLWSYHLAHSVSHWLNISMMPQ